MKWVAIETIGIVAAMAAVFIFADGHWKWMALFLLFALTTRGKVGD